MTSNSRFGIKWPPGLQALGSSVLGPFLSPSGQREPYLERALVFDHPNYPN